ncbi:DUF1206 domain-containing protein [Palleronia sp. LCG004]|uniref:DUF1206 domain-containing protein n=1 Tax=Palleronia sp. LCG004 TaxID=3079304 RepID=UPI002942C1AD|nr:DUF1206 domain-containing protein [Palleronia sp. LCG004]WOI57008.1 DUF1206 domain-containing protein [Palleronia sp. LCG004]
MSTKSDFGWAIPIMRAGYAGRALVYLVVAGFSLWAVSRGGEAQGTTSAFKSLESTAGGNVVLVAIFLGMVSYAVWRIIDSIFDLEDYGTDGEGMVARAGMIVTGLIHLGIGFAAVTLIFAGGGGEGDQSAISKGVTTVLGWPGGRWIVGAVGLITIGSALYYLKKAWKREYRKVLMGNPVTRNFDPALRGGVASQGFVVGVIGCLIVYAAVTFSGDQAGGMGEAFDWLRGQPYGRVLVGLLCAGLLGFALFCAVNAAYRIVPKARQESIDSLASRMTEKAKSV